MSTKTAMKKAVKIVGSKLALSRALGISYQSMDRWSERNCMPATEYNGKTMYSRKIQELTDGQVTIEDLCGFVPPPQA